MKKIISIVFLGFTLVSSISAQSLKEIVDSKYVDQLISTGNVSLIHEKKDTTMSMVPETVYSSQIKSNLKCANASGVPFLAEFLYLIPKTELTDDVSKVNIDTISVLFRKISGMEGMKYIHNGKKEDILYKKCFAIEYPGSFTPIPDPLEGDVNGLKVYAYQHDHTFGDTKYLLNYYCEGNVLLVTFVNQIPMGMLGVNAVMAEKMKMNVMCIDLGDNLLLYLSTDIDAKNILGVRAQIEDSMTVRMDAIYRWFLKRFK